MFRLSGFVILATVSSLIVDATARQIDFQFQVYRLDEATAAALEERLLGGGGQAVQAMERMPDLIRQRRAKLEAELKLRVTSGQRAKAASSDRMLPVDRELKESGRGFEVVDGLGLEIDPVIGASGAIVDANLAGEYSERSRNGANTHRLITSVIMVADEPLLLCRWQEGEDVLVFVGTASTGTAKGAIPEAKPLIYVDAAFYESAAEAQASRAPVARALFPSRSGQRAKAEMVESISFDAGGGLEMMNLGLSAEVDVVLDQAGTAIDLSSVVQFKTKASGSVRLATGDRIPKVEIQTAKAQITLQDGQTEVVDVEEQIYGPSQQEPSDWKATLGFHLMKVK